MRNLFLFTVASVFSIAVYAQKGEPVAPPQLPKDTITNKITYSQVVEVKGVSADTLYRRILEWANSFYPNPSEVIREKDDDNRKIVAKPRYRIYNAPDKEGTKAQGGFVQYTMTIAAREGRFKYEITDLNWVQQSAYAVERWYDTSSPYYSKNFPEYLKQTDEYMKDVVAKLKKAATTTKAIKKDDW